MLTFPSHDRVEDITLLEIVLAPGAVKVFEENTKYTDFISEGPSENSRLGKTSTRVIIFKNNLSHAVEYPLEIPERQSE